MKILYAASEALPFAASGGLADVMGALPKAMVQQQCDCRVVLPLYRSVKPAVRNQMTFLKDFDVEIGWRKQYCGVYTIQRNGVIYYLLDNPYYFMRDGMYGFYDDAERFIFFSRAVLELLSEIAFFPDLIHCNDWQTAMIPVYYDIFYKYRQGYEKIKTIYTIHNIQYQGVYGKEIISELMGIPTYYTNLLDYDGCVNLMKGAIETADCVTTVSPTYAKGAGQFEHTLIIVEEGANLHFIEGCSAPKYNVANLHAGCVELYVGKNATLRYSTIENWSKNMYNLNTKRALVEEGGKIEWVSGSFGSHVSYLYPMSILKGKGAKMEFTGITFAGNGQDLDTGAKVVHAAPDTSSYINTKSISKDGGVSTFRSAVTVQKEAVGSKSSVSCESLMLDSISRSDTIPAIDVRTGKADVGHEAQIGKISNEAIFYLMSRGLSEEDARACIVSGFADNVSKELPLEYAIEMNNLIRLEMKGSIG